MEAIIFIGLQGAGKSTYYRERFFHTHIRLNLDMLRTRHRERILLQACLSAKQPFVVDNTNVLVEERALYIARAKQAVFQVIGYYFKVDIQAALKRNSGRTGRAVVPDKAIWATYNRLQVPQQDEGFDQLNYVTINGVNEFEVREWLDEV